MTVDGVVAELGKRVDVETQVVAVDGAPVGVRPDLVYYLLNKPAGVITTADDPQGRPTVVDVVPDEPRVFSVGRLDAETEGLLVMTNDGQLTHHLTHPSFGVEKEYLALVEGEPSRASLRTLRDGVDLEDGPTARARVTAVESGTCSASRSTKDGTGRFVECAMRSAIRSCDLCALGSGRSPIRVWRRGSGGN